MKGMEFESVDLPLSDLRLGFLNLAHLEALVGAHSLARLFSVEKICIYSVAAN